jgi:hypothetical protein
MQIPALRGCRPTSAQKQSSWWAWPSAPASVEIAWPSEICRAPRGLLPPASSPRPPRAVFHSCGCLHSPSPRGCRCPVNPAVGPMLDPTAQAGDLSLEAAAEGATCTGRTSRSEKLLEILLCFGLCWTAVIVSSRDLIDKKLEQLGPRVKKVHGF